MSSSATMAAGKCFGRRAPLMAASLLASKRHPLSRSSRPVTLPVASSFFSTNAVPLYDSDDRDFRSNQLVFSPFYVCTYADLLDSFSTGSSLSEDSGIDNGENWKTKETDDGLLVYVDMPGLGKEDVKVSVEQDMVIVKGEGKMGSEDGDETDVRSYNSKIDLPGNLFKIKAIKAEMKNGVLTMFVPKIKEEERTDVFHVSVE